MSSKAKAPGKKDSMKVGKPPAKDLSAARERRERREGPPASTSHPAPAPPAHDPPSAPDGTPVEDKPSTRLCIKNFPKYVNEDRLRKHFSLKGEVTDIKIMKTPDGNSRQFGFVGYKTLDQAIQARKYFDRSFFDTLRLSVEYSHKVGDGTLDRPWSKYSKGSSRYEQLHQPEAPPPGAAESDKAKPGKKKGKTTVLDMVPDDIKNDPKLKEFLSVMQPRAAAKIWANDDSAPPAALAAQAGGPGGAGKKAKAGAGGAARRGAGSDSESDDELYEDIPGGPGGPGGLGGEEEEEEEEEDPSPGGAPKVDVGPVDDLAYLRSRAAVIRDEEEEEEEEGEGAGGEGGSDEDEAWLARVSGGSGAGGAAVSDKAAEEDDLSDKEGSGGDAMSDSDEEGAGGEEEEEGGKKEGDKDKKGGGKRNEIDAIFSGEGAEEDEEDEEDLAARRATASLFGDAGAAPPPRPAPPPGGAAAILETGRLFVRNLVYSCTEEELREEFERFGALQEVHVCLDRDTRRCKGFAYVSFDHPPDAQKAYEEMDGNVFQGRLLHILAADRPPKREGEGEGEGGEGGFKKQKEEKLRAGAGNKAAWNSLFMRQDTVLEAIASHYGVPKSELLDAASSDMAVRVALGEAWVVGETKRSLGEGGVGVEAIEESAQSGASSSAPRSPTALMVKNLPYSTTEEDLEQLFGKVGPLSRLVLASTRTLAVVEYIEAQDARTAFRTLAYRRFQHVPLYLEWAPAGVFTAAAAAAPRRVADSPPPPAVAAATTAPPSAALPESGALDAESNTLFVKGLAFATTDASLKRHVERSVKALGLATDVLRSARVATKPAPKGQTGVLSKGFGFLEFSTPEVAASVLAKLQGSSLEGHKLQVSFSGQDGAAGAAGAGGAASRKKQPQVPEGYSRTKLVVRNVAFEATRRDLLGLFTPFGEVKSCRLPRKFDGNHRGFAFVDFATPQEAQNAVDGLKAVHLYGRHVVIERAKEGEDVEDLREKQADRMRKAEEFLEGGKRKKRRGAEES